MISDAATHQSDSHTELSEQFKPTLKVGDYLLIQSLGQSGQARLHLSRKNQKLYALKLYPVTPKNNRTFQNQVCILKRMEHPGILPLIESLSECRMQNSELSQVHLYNYISTTYMEKGNLYQWVQTKLYFPEKEAKYLGLQLVSRLRYLHDQQVYHRDIKPENILLGQDFNPLIIDFGLAIDQNISSRGFVGSCRYAAPEIIKEKEYTYASEVYSLGIFLFFILTGHYPFKIAKISDPNFRIIFEQKYQKFWSSFQNKSGITLSTSFKELFVSMTNPNPLRRPSLDDLLDFSWLTSGVASYDRYRHYMHLKEFGYVVLQQ